LADEPAERLEGGVDVAAFAALAEARQVGSDPAGDGEERRPHRRRVRDAVEVEDRRVALAAPMDELLAELRRGHRAATIASAACPTRLARAASAAAWRRPTACPCWRPTA